MVSGKYPTKEIITKKATFSRCHPPKTTLPRTNSHVLPLEIGSKNAPKKEAGSFPVTGHVFSRIFLGQNFIPPGSLTATPLNIYHPKRKVVFQPSIFRGYVKLRGCIFWVRGESTSKDAVGRTTFCHTRKLQWCCWNPMFWGLNTFKSFNIYSSFFWGFILILMNYSILGMLESISLGQRFPKFNLH